MPTSKVASREFLYNVKFQGINTIGLHDYISNWKNESLLAMTICTGIDYEFVFSKEYEKARKKFIQKNLYKQIYHTSHLSIFNRLLLPNFQNLVIISVINNERFAKLDNWKNIKHKAV